MIKFAAVLVSAFVLGIQPGLHQGLPMTFFITSAGPGDGANLGGLEGADRHCQQLAQAVGAEDREWHAYLSTIDDMGRASVHARDRIGSGPWHNFNGTKIADNVDDLHSDQEAYLSRNRLIQFGFCMSRTHTCSRRPLAICAAL